MGLHGLGKFKHLATFTRQRNRKYGSLYTATYEEVAAGYIVSEAINAYVIERQNFTSSDYEWHVVIKWFPDGQCERNDS